MNSAPELPCSVCSGGFNEIWHEAGYFADQCLQCQIIQSRSATKAEFEKRYFENQAGQSHLRLARINHFRQIVAELPVPLEPPILDVGAGLGFFFRALPPHLSRTMILVEPSSFARQYLRDTHQVNAYKSLTEIPHHYPPFTMVTFWDVLAHVEDPVDVLTTARNLIKRNGLLLIKTPFHPLRLFKAARLFAPIRKGHSLLHIPSMRFHFTPNNLMPLLQGSGFDVETWQWTSEAPLFMASKRTWVKEFFLHLSTRLITDDVSFITLARAV